MNLIKLNEIKDLLGDDFLTLLDVYTSDTNNRYTELEKALKGDDFNSIRQLSHAMKSSSANIGADTVSSIAAKIEEAAKEETRNPILESLPQLKKAIEEAIQIMNNE